MEEDRGNLPVIIMHECARENKDVFNVIRGLLSIHTLWHTVIFHPKTPQAEQLNIVNNIWTHWVTKAHSDRTACIFISRDSGNNGNVCASRSSGLICSTCLEMFMLGCISCFQKEILHWQNKHILHITFKLSVIKCRSYHYCDYDCMHRACQDLSKEE